MRKIHLQKITMAAFLLLCIAAQAQTNPGPESRRPKTPEAIEAAKPNPQAPGFRIPLPPLDQMDPAMREDFIKIAQGQQVPIGNRFPLTLSPELSNIWNQVLPALTKTAIPKDLFQMTILMVARDFDCQFEWWMHATDPALPQDQVEAIRVGKLPKFATPTQDAAYHYLIELLRDHKVTDAGYEKLRVLIGSRQMVELTTLAGYYSTVAMNMVAPNLPLRADVKPPLPELANRFPR